VSLLEAESINSYYGDSHILFDVSLRVERNEVVALLGRNGAGAPERSCWTARKSSTCRRMPSPSAASNSCRKTAAYSAA